MGFLFPFKSMPGSFKKWQMKDYLRQLSIVIAGFFLL